MRPTPPNIDPRIWPRLEEARELLRQGDVSGALDRYTSTWGECVATADHYHASVIAHMAGVAEPDTVKKHEWNLRAISEADQVADRSVVKGRVRVQSQQPRHVVRATGRPEQGDRDIRSRASSSR